MTSFPARREAGGTRRDHSKVIAADIELQAIRALPVFFPNYRDDVFFLGTFAPFLRASERPIAIACLRLFTVPPFPPRPDLSVPFFFRRMALATVFPAAFP